MLYAVCSERPDLWPELFSVVDLFSFLKSGSWHTIDFEMSLIEVVVHFFPSS